MPGVSIPGVKSLVDPTFSSRKFSIELITLVFGNLLLNMRSACHGQHNIVVRRTHIKSALKLHERSLACRKVDTKVIKMGFGSLSSDKTAKKSPTSVFRCIRKQNCFDGSVFWRCFDVSRTPFHHHKSQLKDFHPF